jgi:predicted nucleic acid-binding protein
VAVTARYLVDTSAAARMNRSVVADWVGPLLDSGLAATTAVLDAEALYSAKSASDFAHIRERRRLAYEYLPTDDEHWQLAIDALMRLAQQGRHRSVGIADMLTAVTARTHRLTVLHYDADFETASAVIDFEHRWVAEPGTL